MLKSLKKWIESILYWRVVRCTANKKELVKGLKLISLSLGSQTLVKSLMKALVSPILSHTAGFISSSRYKFHLEQRAHVMQQLGSD